MYSILLLVLILSFVGFCTTNEPHDKSVSINSKEYEKKYNIKIISKEETTCEKSEFLNLAHMSLKTTNNDIIQSNVIRHVSLYNNFLKKVPHNILDLVPQLSCLNLSCNSINIYESNFIRHANLRVLDLSYQKKSIVNNIPEMEFVGETEGINGQNIYNIIEYNKYKYMIFNSTNMKCPNLEYLVLNGNDISDFQWDFNLSFPKLIRLDLVNVYADTIKQDFFNKIPTSLKILHLENNNLRNLTLPKLGEIMALYLDGNPLERLDIISMSLRTLSLTNCTNKFEGYFGTPHLQELDLSRNNFDDAFASARFNFTFPVLHMLILDYNKLSNIPNLNINSQQFNELSLNYNTIKYIRPYSFKNLKDLIKLSLKGNKLYRLEKETFLGLEKLEYLDLSENQLNFLSPDWAWPLQKLTFLNVNSNQFASISEIGVFSIRSLQYLFVTNNSFTKISTLELDPLPNFVTVYLA
ncbi:protein artichoke [Monomorium pharaonis]|uniref:protein artichoke n=1 Tax=Monomorium pharaonis TaxID=307658 RepID=UPI00063EEA17|nr:protein artichoke [Monomorium pharaonis]